MAKASPAFAGRQATALCSAAVPHPLGPTFLTPDCGYSVVEGLLYCELVDDLWFPGDPLLLNFETNYRPLISHIRRCRRELRRELRRTISPRRKREIRLQRHVLSEALLYFEPAAAFSEFNNGRGTR